VVDAIRSKFEDTTINSLVKGVLVFVDRQIQSVCEELDMEIQGTQLSI
jgi:hypothetical protein